MDRQLKKYIYLALGILSLVILAYILNFASFSFSSVNSDWGNFGDYVGGVAGAFLALLTVILLIITLDSQNKNATTNQFESSFFELFRLHKEITDRIVGEIYVPIFGNERKGDWGTFEGLEFFDKLSKRIDRQFDVSYKNIKRESIKESLREEIEYDQNEMQNEIDEFYDELYSGRESELGHYFRSLYHLLKFVDKADIDNPKKYTDLVQAYLTDAELHCTFYNGISRFGREKFKPLLDKYSFLENIKPKGLIFIRHFSVFYPNTYNNFRNKPRSRP